MSATVGFTFWYRLTSVVPDKGRLNGCVCVCVCVCVCWWVERWKDQNGRDDVVLSPYCQYYLGLWSISPGISRGVAAPLLNPCMSPLVQSTLLVSSQSVDFYSGLSGATTAGTNAVSGFSRLFVHKKSIWLFLNFPRWFLKQLTEFTGRQALANCSSDVGLSESRNGVLHHICCAASPVSICGHEYSSHQLA